MPSASSVTSHGSPCFSPTNRAWADWTDSSDGEVEAKIVAADKSPLPAAQAPSPLASDPPVAVGVGKPKKTRIGNKKLPSPVGLPLERFTFSPNAACGWGNPGQGAMSGELCDDGLSTDHVWGDRCSTPYGDSGDEVEFTRARVMPEQDTAPVKGPLWEVWGGSGCGIPTLPVSVGSIGHDLGTCKPCLFVNTPMGCNGGPQCQFCHFPHKKTKRPCKAKRDRYYRLMAKHYETAGSNAGTASIINFSDM